MFLRESLQGIVTLLDRYIVLINTMKTIFEVAEVIGGIMSVEIRIH